MPIKYIRFAVSSLLLIAAIAIVARQTEWDGVIATFSRLSLTTLGIVVLSLLGGSLLATLRLKWIASDLGYRLSFLDSMAALSLGQLMGAVFFQIAGQLLARGTILSRRQVPPSATVIITGYERFLALGISLSLALIATAYLFGSVSIDYQKGGAALIKLIIGLVLVAIAGAIFAWGKALTASMPPLTPRILVGLARSAVLSLFIQLFTMTAYMSLIHVLAPGIPWTTMAAATALIMLAASIPISLAGWGLREMSALSVLGLLGVSSQAALTVALSVGVLSLAVSAIMALSALGHAVTATPAGQNTAGRSLNYVALLDIVIPLAAATAVFFQVFLPVRDSVISVNLADPIVILGGSLFVLHQVGRRALPQWRMAHFNVFVLGATAAVVVAYFIGLTRFGYTNWAFANRLVGWPILLSYGAVGALIVHRMAHGGYDMLLRTFVATGLTIFVLSSLAATAYASGVLFLRDIVVMPIEGFAQNRNTFALQMLLVICVLIATRWPYQALWLGVAVAGLASTGSRAGYIAFAVLGVMVALVAPLPWRRLAGAAAVAGTILAVSHGLPTTIVAMSHTLPDSIMMPITVPGNAGTGGVSVPDSVLQSLAHTESSNQERLKSLIGGWELFTAHPIFGAGLGAYVDETVRAGKSLVIHSTPLWLLAEFGIIGFILIAAPLILVFYTEVSRWRSNDDAGRLLVLSITAFAVMSLAHELLYQRAFWLLLGATLAMLPGLSNQAPDTVPKARV